AFPLRWEGEVLRYDGLWGLRARETLAALDGLAREDVAAWVQRGAEAVLVEGVRRWLAATGTSRVALAGGVFANVRVNGLLAGLVFPHMGDGGLAAGAALHAADAEPAPLGDVYLGPDETEAACEAAARGAGFAVSRPADPDAVLVARLAAGDAVVRCVGRMEF